MRIPLPARSRHQCTLAAALLTAAAVSLAGCNDSFSSTSPPGPPPALQVQASPASLTVFTGQPGTVAIAVTRTAFSGDVALVVSGAPTGVSASLEPPAIGASSTTSTLVLAVGADATPGQYSLVVTGTGSGVTASATVALTVARLVIPTFSLAVTPARLDISPGGSAEASAVVTRDAGFAGSVDLVFSGPANAISAIATPSRIVSPVDRSRLQFTVAANTPPGTYTFVVTGSSGSESRTAVVTITVVPAQPLTISCAADDIGYWTVLGSTWQWEVAILRGAGFTAAVDLTAEGLPEGVGVTITPSRLEPGVTRSRVDVTAAATAKAGNYTFTFRGKGSGIPDATTQCRLVVFPPA